MARRMPPSSGMARRSWIMLVSLAAFWGASYLFIKVALNDGVPPA